jgi:Uma2 family endonuclease
MTLLTQNNLDLWQPPTVPVRRFTVDEYHRMIAARILQEDEPIELLEGLLVPKMTRNPPHDTVLGLLEDEISRCLPKAWFRRGQSAMTTPDSEPEPDLAVVRGERRDYRTWHPGPGDLGLVVEVSDSSLFQDRTLKVRIYARAAIPVYWTVNIPDNQVEVYTNPSGPTAESAYQQQQIYRPGDQVPLVLDGQEVARIAVADLLG